MSQTLKGGLKHDTWALGKNTKKHFDRWDRNKDGQIDMDEVHWGLFYSSVNVTQPPHEREVLVDLE